MNTRGWRPRAGGDVARLAVPAAALLSACGVLMLVPSARSGAGGWDCVLWQVAGCVAGAWAFRATRRRPWPDARGGFAVFEKASYTGSGLLLAAEAYRLAIDRTLLADALERAQRSEIAAYAMVVDAKDASAAAFYRHHGFMALTDQPLTLFLPLATARVALANISNLT